MNRSRQSKRWSRREGLAWATIPVAFIAGWIAFFRYLPRDTTVAALIALATVATIALAFTAAMVIAGRRFDATVHTLTDPLLGTLTYDGKHWVSTVSLRGRDIRFLVGGDLSPDPDQLRQAQQLLSSFDELLDAIRRFLDSEAGSREFAPFADEIAHLEVELIWIDAGGVELWFDGGNDERSWQCDWTAGKPSALDYTS
ncbi:MAG: hypothetical protein AB7O24_05420 [Kofleriaceae bacterium]